MPDASPATRTQLTRYRSKRDFSKTREPSGEKQRRTHGDSYLVQKHAARRLHYDFRLELDGVLKSWAVTRGPSLNPADKRLAVHVEDHPLDYGSFEGTIPQGQYGGGTVMLWDQGTWHPSGDPRRDYARGNLTFELAGKRLKGRWHLVRLRGNRAGDTKRENWLLIKGKDEYADPAHGDAALEKYQKSVVSGRGMEGIARAKGKAWGRGGARPKSVVEADEAVKALEKKAGTPPRRTRIKRLAAPKGSSPVEFITPQLATLVAAPPTGKGWVHEIKFDGYRLLALLEKSQVRLFTRAGNDWTARFKPLCKALSKLPVHSAIIDGEAVNTNADGVHSFHALQEALSTGRLEHLRYYAFDLLLLDGIDLRQQPLADRKSLLQTLLEKAPQPLQYSQHFTEPGDRILTHACHLALEGIVSKRADSRYHSGRTTQWLKSKCIKEQEFVIGGYTEQPKHPGTLGALLMGYYEKDRLRFGGKVGTGFTAQEGRALLQTLRTRARKTSSFDTVPADVRREGRFIEPDLVAHINFGEWTPDGKLRHASFQGLREDKPAKEVVREKEKSMAAIANSQQTSTRPGRRTQPTAPSRTNDEAVVSGVTITHPDRVLWPDGGITKLELAQYYAAIAPKLLAHAGNRPISLVRCPRGPGKQCFFQRHAGEGMDSKVHAINVAGRGEGKPFIFIDDVTGLVSLVQMGTIELHAWNATVSDVKKPDQLIFDLDPGPGVGWEAVKEAAKYLREGLKKLRLAALLKTTGGKGLHVVVPFNRGPGWAEAKQFARSFADTLAEAEPDRFTINIRKDMRPGRIFIDYLRNDETSSAVAPYSVRARPGAPVSVPIDWSELARLRSADAFHIKDVLKRRKDPWAQIAKLGKQKLPVG